MLQVLQGNNVEFEEYDVSDPALDEPRRFMRRKCLTKEGQKYPLPPQIFNDEEYCGVRAIPYAYAFVHW